MNRDWLFCFSSGRNYWNGSSRVTVCTENGTRINFSRYKIFWKIYPILLSQTRLIDLGETVYDSKYAFLCWELCSTHVCKSQAVKKSLELKRIGLALTRSLKFKNDLISQRPIASFYTGLLHYRYFRFEAISLQVFSATGIFSSRMCMYLYK